MNVNDITYQIRGAIFEVNRILGPGFLEKVYENALLVELKKRGVKAESQVPISVFYKKSPVGEYFADIMAEDKVVLELKVADNITEVHEAQALHYLKATSFRLAIILNFGKSKLQLKRIVLWGQSSLKPISAYLCLIRGIRVKWT